MLKVRNHVMKLVLAAALAGLAAGPSMAGLSDDVREAIRTADMKEAIVGVSVRDADTDRLLISIEGDQPFIPASNMKLLTTGTALHVLGPSFSFQTRLINDKNRLVVVGDGDPAFGDPELLEIMPYRDSTGAERTGMDIETFLSLWIKPIQDLQKSEFDEIIVDDRIFDREFVHPSWPVDQLNTPSFAQVSGFNVHLNMLYFYPKPGKQRPEISNFQPFAPWLTPRNQGTCVSTSNNTAWLSRTLGTNELCFRGNVKFSYREPVRVTLNDVPAFFGRLLSERLKSLGIKVGGVRTATSSDPEFVGEAIGPTVQSPLTTVLSRCNVDSQNLYAECLLKRSGAGVTRQSGSWASGTSIVRHVVIQRVNDPKLTSGFIAADGSGLSKENRVPPNLMTAWLNSFHQDSSLSAGFVESLAVGGETGTIKSRFRQIGKSGAIVQCKTGFVNGVSCLSGYVTMPDGRRRSFSIMCNKITEAGGVAKAKKLQEAIVQAIADDMASVAPVLGGN